MKRTTNKYQKAYMTAKARVQEIESQQEAIEKKYIADNGIVKGLVLHVLLFRVVKSYPHSAPRFTTPQFRRCCPRLPV